MLWKATSGARPHRGKRLFVIPPHTIGLCCNLTITSHGWNVSTPSQRSGGERGGEGFADLLFFFFFPLIPSPTPSPHSFYFHVNFSTPFSPRHSEKSLRSPQQGSSFFFFSFSKHLISTCTESYNRTQYWRCFQFQFWIFIFFIFYFFNRSNAQLTSVSIPASLRLRTLTRQNLRDAGESARRRSRAIVCLVCLWLGT